MSLSKDQRLLARIARGDQRALADLYDSHAALLAFRLRRDGASLEETEDVLQETFLDVWRSAVSYRGDSEAARLALGDGVTEVSDAGPGRDTAATTRGEVTVRAHP